MPKRIIIPSPQQIRKNKKQTANKNNLAKRRVLRRTPLIEQGNRPPQLILRKAMPRVVGANTRGGRQLHPVGLGIPVDRA
jgi:hypothetical protein